MAHRFHNFQKIIFLPLLLAGFFSIAPSAHATITVTAPSSGTSWQAGTTHTISWSGGGSWVTRIYLNTPTAVALVIATNLSNTGSYSWTIPTSVAPATNYLIYVETATCNGCGASDWVYGPQFTITVPVLTITAPSSGTSWQAGTTHTISWSGGGSWVTRIYLNTPTAVALVIATNLSNTGSYSWTIPTSVAPATNYLIYVETATCNGCGASDWVYGPQFTITAPASNAAFISQTPPPSSMTVGQVATVSVTMQNISTDTWVQGGANPYRLGSQNPQDNNTWGLGRVTLPQATVAPGESIIFAFTVTAPSTPGTYNFRWRMVKEGITWFGAYSTNVTVTVTAADTTPPVISSVAASGITTSGATITWTTNEVSDSRVEYGLTSAYGSAVSVAESVTSHSSALSGLSAGTLYHYRVRSRDAALNTSYSPDATFTTTSAPDTTAPAPPTVSMGSATQNSLTASWSGATDNVAVTGYRLDVSTSAAFGTFVSGYNNLDVGNVVSRLISGLSPSTTYYARVRAYDAAGNTSANSNVPSLGTIAPPPPPNVSGYAWADDIIGWIHMSGTAGDSSPYGVFVSSASPGVLSGYAWANPNDGVQNHIGWIDFGPAGSYPVSSFVPAQSARLNRTTGLVSGWARVCSVFASGCSGALKADSERGGWDGWIGFGTGGNYTQPVTVSGCNWSGYAWGGGTTIGWIHFGGALYPTTGSGDACAAVTPACSDGIDNDGDGLIDLADPGCIDANDDDEAGPAAPSGLSADAGSGAVCNAMVIAWTDNATNEDRFELERKRSSDPDTAYVEIAEPSVNSTSFTDTGAVGGLLRDTSYTYRIRACNAFGCSAYSNTDTAINQNPLPSFTWTPPSPLQNANTTFNASASTIYGGSSASEYLWTLTDGIPATFCSSVAGSGCDNPPLTPLASTRFQLPPSPEQKSVILRVTDSASRSCSFTQTVSLRTNSTLPHWREEAPE